MSRRKVIWLLLWLAWPSVCLALATFCLFLCKSDMGRTPVSDLWDFLWRSYLYRLLPC